MNCRGFFIKKGKNGWYSEFLMLLKQGEMIVKKIIFLIFLTLSTLTFGFDDEEKYKVNAYEEARKMLDVFQKKEWEMFLCYVHPTLINSLGEKEEALEQMVEIIKRVTENIEISYIEIEKPEEILIEKNTVQTKLKQKMKMKSHDVEVEVTSYLVGIYYIDKKRWYFMDATGKRYLDIKNFIEDLSDEFQKDDFITESKIIN